MNDRRQRISQSVMVVLVSMVPVTGLAQEVIPEDVKAEQVLAADPEQPQGWQLKLSLGSTASYNHSSHVVGVPDGATVQLGAVLQSGATWRNGGHEWENSLSIKETQTRTPTLDTFVKSADELDLKSTYLYHLSDWKWLGPYVRGRLTTQLFHGQDIRPTAVNVQRVLRDGTTVDKAKAPQELIALTRPFEPLVVKESAGLFAHPVTEKHLTLQSKAGVGMQHIWVGDGFSLQDDSGDPILYQQLEDSTQGGVALEVNGTGAVTEMINWGAGASVFLPFWTTGVDVSGVSFADLITYDLSAKVSVRLAKWASLDYVLSAKRLPLVQQEWQVQNGVMLTAGFDVI